MLDINFIRENSGIVKKAIKDKKIDLDLDQLLKVDQKRREYIVKIDDLRSQRNQAARGRDIERGKKIKNELEKLEDDFKVIETDFNNLMVKVPTPPSEDTPIGEGEGENVEVYSFGEIPKLSFTPKDHIQLGKDLDIIDFEKGANVSGYRGYYLKNEGAVLVMALMMYAFKKAIEKGFKPMIPPTLVKGFALFGTGYFKGLSYDPQTDEIYQVASVDKEESGEVSKEKKFLVGTAEPSLLAYFAGETLDQSELPIKLAGFSQCYRSEIGSYGKDTKGMYRVHEFLKVELVGITKANIEQSDKLQQEMVEIVKEMLQELGLPYRVIQMCTGDLSVGKYKQFDFEVWMPGLKRWAETGSASNFLDWQSRRLDVKEKDEDGKKRHVFMLNSTALPSPRPFIAILENFQQEDGSVKIPEVLIPYTGFSGIYPKK